MNFITADPTMVTRLRGIAEPVEVRDTEGNVLGHFTPIKSPEELALYERARKLFDFEKAKHVAETERHLAKPTAEVLREIQAQGQTP